MDQKWLKSHLFQHKIPVISKRFEETIDRPQKNPNQTEPSELPNTLPK